MSATGSMTGWGVGSSVPSVSTIQSFQTADLRAGSKEAVSVGIFAGIIPLFRSLVTLAVSQADFSLPSLHPKTPFPAAGFRWPIPFGGPGILRALGGKKSRFEPGVIIAGSIRAPRTAGSIRLAHRAIVRLRYLAAAGLRPRPARDLVRETR